MNNLKQKAIELYTHNLKSKLLHGLSTEIKTKQIQTSNITKIRTLHQTHLLKTALLGLLGSKIRMLSNEEKYYNFQTKKRLRLLQSSFNALSLPSNVSKFVKAKQELRQYIMKW